MRQLRLKPILVFTYNPILSVRMLTRTRIELELNIATQYVFRLFYDNSFCDVIAVNRFIRAASEERHTALMLINLQTMTVGLLKRTFSL